MKIVHVLPKFSPSCWGGAETMVAALARVWTGGELEVWTCRLRGDAGSETVGAAHVRRFRALYFGGVGRQGDGKAGLPPGLFSCLVRLPRRNSVVHVHCHNRLAAAVIATSRLMGVKTVLTVHSRVARIDPRWRYWLPNEFPLVAADVVTAVSEAVREQIKSVGRMRVELTPNGIDLEWIRAGDRARGRRALRLGEEVRVVLFCGRISRVKNLGALLQAAERLTARASDVKVVIAGPVADHKYNAELRAQIASTSLSKHVLFLGAIAPGSEALADLYAAADVVVVPSVWEAQSLTVLEAWGAGRTVVVADVGGMGELVRSEGIGRLWDPGTGDSGLAAEIDEALKAARQDAGTERRARAAAERFDIRRTAALYYRLYEDLLSNKFGATR